MRFSTETENCTGLKMSGGAETVQFCRSAPFGNQNWSISGPVQGGGTRFPEDRGGVEATRRVKLNGAEMKIGTKIVQKRSEMFGPVGFPIGGWIGASAAGDSEPKLVQNQCGIGGRFCDPPRAFTADRHRPTSSTLRFDASAVTKNQVGLGRVRNVSGYNNSASLAVAGRPNGSNSSGRLWLRNASQTPKNSTLFVTRRMSCRNRPLGSAPTAT